MITRIFEYQEEDGFPIIRGGIEYRVYGSAEAKYSYSYTSGRMYTPDEEDLECESFTCYVESICDEEGIPVDIELTEEEDDDFEVYMQERLDEIAQDTDWREDEADARAEAEWEENHESV